MYFAPVQTSPGAHLDTYTMGTPWSFVGVKNVGHGFNYTPQYCAKVKGRVEQYRNSSSVPSWQVIV